MTATVDDLIAFLCRTVADIGHGVVSGLRAIDDIGLYWPWRP